jgi:Kef-type K+ transport system membrane component KefB
MSNFELSVRFFLQLAIILATCRLVGWFARKLGQPQVVGEMIAGVLLGPSLFGLLLPEIQQQLFPKETMSVLYVISQLGLTLYMFLIGVEFQAELVRTRLGSAAAISLAGIVAPFTLGAALALWLTSDPRFFAPQVAPWQAMLFMGAAMGITAFPMLARIIHERGLAGTRLGALALSAGASDDVIAWCLLAVVLAAFSGQPLIAVAAIGGGTIYAVGVLWLGRPALKQLERHAVRDGGLNGGLLGIILALVALAAWLTDTLGIYAVFGAFILGVAMPRGIVSRELQAQIGPLTTSLLLPLFFVYSGLNTRIGLLDSAQLWFIALVVLLAACLGKGVACWLAARASGEHPQDALAIGALMNARGLMELIILNIGLERGIITPTLFTVMVVMAVVTTLLATPLFEWALNHSRSQIADRRLRTENGDRVTG